MRYAIYDIRKKSGFFTRSPRVRQRQRVRLLLLALSLKRLKFFLFLMIGVENDFLHVFPEFHGDGMGDIFVLGLEKMGIGRRLLRRMRLGEFTPALIAKTRPNDIPVPAFLRLVERGEPGKPAGRRWAATLRGSAGDLLRWAADLPVEDITIGQPDLASLFQAYSQSPEVDS
jgi:hypothetical protein